MLINILHSQINFAKFSIKMSCISKLYFYLFQVLFDNLANHWLFISHYVSYKHSKCPDILWDLVTRIVYWHWIHENTTKIISRQRIFQSLICNFVVIEMSASFGARISAGTVMTKFVYCIFIGHMIMRWNKNIFYVAGPHWGDSTNGWRIPLTKG